jgi:FkbM family methyltransferase
MISYSDLVSESLANPRLVLLKLGKITEQKIFSRLLNSSAQKEINGIKFDFDFSLSPFVKDMYFGNYEVATVEYLKKILKIGDVFIDVGANIGYVSAVAAGCVGAATGEVHSFEPVPEYFRKLKQMADQNNEYKIRANQCGLGDKTGFLELDVSKSVDYPNIGWNTMVPGLMSNHEPKQTINVPVYTLDKYIEKKRLGEISVIKIDVEGFEFPVLKGLHNFFETTDEKPVIICEIAPAAYPLLGYTLSQMSDYMASWSYEAFSLIVPTKVVDITKLKETTNVVFHS